MKKIIIHIFFLLISFQIFSFESPDFVKNAVEQIDYLYARNAEIERTSSSDKKWYLYFVNRDKKALESYLIGNSTIKSFSSGYLEHLNNLLTAINATGKVTMYVAISDYDTPITVPIIPSGKSLEDKIQTLRNALDPQSAASLFSKEDLDPDQIKTGIKDYGKYKTFFYEKADEIFENSVLSKASDGKRVMMPFSMYHYINFHNKKRKYYTFLMRASNPTKDQEADDTAKDFRSAYFTLKGKSVDEKKLEKVVQSYLDFYSGNTGVTITANAIKKQIPKDSELYTRAFGENGFTPDTSFDLSKHMLDFSGMLSEQEKSNILQEIDFNRELFSGMKMYVVLTDKESPSGILDKMKDLEPKSNQYVIWLHLDEEGYLNLSNITPQGFDERIAYATSHWTEKMWANAELNLGKGTVAHLKANLAITNQLLTYASDILALGIVPEKYWNPKHQDYPKYMPFVASAFNVTMGDFGSVLNAQQAQMQFAFKIGIWNGVIDEVKGLADAGKMATEYFLNPEKAGQFDQGMSQLTFGAVWDSFKKAHGFEEGNETNEFKLSHQLGKDVVFVASFFIGVGEIAALAKTGKMAKLGTLANNMSKLSKVIAGGVIKILKKMPPNIAKTIKKLPDNIIKEVQKIGAKSYLILKLNTTKLAKISDDAVFSEMKLLQDGAIVKLTDGKNAIFDNVKYIDDAAEQTGTIAIVKKGDEIGVKTGMKADDLIETVFDVTRDGDDFIIKHSSGTELCRGWKEAANEIEFTVEVIQNGVRYGYGKAIRKQVFDEMSKTTKIDGIRSHWVEGPDLDTNLKAFNDAIAAGKSVDEAALATKAGEWNKELGFDKVEIVGTPIIRGGKYKDVTFRFKQKVARSIDEILVNGKIPTVKKGFNKWYDELTLEEFDKVWGNKELRETIEDRIRYPASYHEWCMVCESRQFKEWKVSMDEIHRFRTKTLELKGTNPKTGEPFAHSVKNSEGKTVSGPGSKTFHNELRDIIGKSDSLEEFNSGLIELIERWEIDPKLLPPFPTN